MMVDERAMNQSSLFTPTAQEALEAVPSYAAIIAGTPEVEAFAEDWYRDKG
jgi:hypothetical protein